MLKIRLETDRLDGGGPDRTGSFCWERFEHGPDGEVLREMIGWIMGVDDFMCMFDGAFECTGNYQRGGRSQ